MFSVEIGRASLILLLCIPIFASTTDYKVAEGCPSSCRCNIIQPRDEFSKVNCDRSQSEVLSVGDLKLNNVKPQIIQLELSLNLTHLEGSFLNLFSLEKLDLSRNGIEDIDYDAFQHLKNLKTLDLSYNKIVHIHKKMFEPLSSLERLKLNNNLIVHLFKGVFDHLISLKILDINENPLDCDCTLVWVTEWSKNSSVKLTLPKCKLPFSNKGKSLRKLKLHCDKDADLYMKSSGLELKPMHNQIVFEGDSLSLRCRSLNVVSGASDSKDVQVTWSWQNKDPSSYFDKIKIKNRSFAENGFVESQLKIDKIQKSHSGDWYCHLFSESGNHSSAISVIVLSDDSKYCPQVDTKNNKGVYFWPKTLVGFTVDLPCAVKQPTIVGNKAEPRAFYTCNESGTWEDLNTTYCPYVSETTRILEQFSQVNLSIAKGSVLDSALKLKNFTGNGRNLTDAMDIVFISKTVENYLTFVKNERELGYVLVDIVGTIMDLSKTLLISAQKESMACSRLVRSLETICRDIPTFQSHKTNLVVDEFGGTGAFSGIRCIWSIANQNDKNPKRFFNCSTNNRSTSLGSSDRIIIASIQIPASLFTQLEIQGKLTHNIWQLIVSMYENNNLFPGPSNTFEDVTSSVIGSKLVGMEVTNLTEPVYIMLRAPSSSYNTLARPVWWDQFLNNGSGGWVEEGCEPSHYTQGMIVFHCNRFGYFGLLQDTRYLNDYSRRYTGNKLRICHPAIYTGSFILIVCLVISAVTYFISHSFIQMSRRAKHSIVNTWISITFLCFTFSCGIYQTDNTAVCQSIGIILHYLFLSTLLWMSVSASNMYKRLSKADPLDSTPEDELPPGVPIQKPILGLYLVGWGIGLIVCGISGAVNMKEYASQNFCFLESGPALSAVYVPAGMLLAFLTLFYILTLCAIRNNDMNGQLSEGTQGTENVDLELLEVPATLGSLDRRSVQSIVTTDSDDIEDPEHSPMIQLKAHVIVLLLYCFICALAALSIADTFQDSFLYYQDVCSILYCFLAFCLGAFVLYFYCVARSDVRSQWTVMRKVLKGEQIHCCRSRSVSDTHVTVQMTTPPVISNGINVRQPISALSSSSMNSSGVTAKSNSQNSNRVKAVKKLNNCETRMEPIVVHSTAANNVNLVAMHRQMYRSNNSVPTYHEILGPDCVEAFYNPRQSIVARKFFKKQRRNKRNDLGLRRRGDGGGTSEGEVSQARRTWRPSAESAVFLSSDMENASEKVESNQFGYGSKLNNGGTGHSGPNIRYRKSLSPNNIKLLTNSDEENRNKLPMDRLVIGAEEETDTSTSLKNSDRVYDHCLSRVDEVSAVEEVGSSPVASTDRKKHSRLHEIPQEEEELAGGRSPDFRTVELQCSLGGTSCPGLSPENFRDFGMDVDEERTRADSMVAGEFCNGEDCDATVVSDSAPNCDSFNEKIDGFRLNSDDGLTTASASSSSTPQKTEPTSKQSVTGTEAFKRLSLPACLDSEGESEALIEDEDSGKGKRETSV